MGQHDQLPCFTTNSPHLVDRPDCAAIVQARHRIVDNDDSVRQIRVQVERGEEEGQCEA